ncbi:uracil-DNA glycosylase [Candidatus Poriferisodalis sp.]|uniref:uracil-DNA glycosylase n=1 Tax=Candidatus Poriferisodalis sp. TaxID=3101277 RepID=UPI003B015FB6
MAADSKGDAGAPSSAALRLLSAEIGACKRCERLVAWRTQTATQKRAAFADEDYWGCGVPGFGDPGAAVVLVGLAPAAHGANRTGRMFTGDRSGDFLYAALHRCGFANQPTSVHAGDGLELRDAYITAAVRCAPPANKPAPEERDACRPFLERELALLGNARVAIVLGAFAYGVLCTLAHIRPRPRFGHGVVVAMPTADRSGRAGGLGGISHIVCSFHPSQQNTFTGRLTADMTDTVLRDARRLANLPLVD